MTDAEIVDGIRLLARTEGIFGETAAGVTIATLAKLAAEGVVRRDERVVAYITGHGLKTLDAIEPHVRVVRHDPAVTRRIPCRVPRGRVRRSDVAVTVRIPTQLRSLAGGAAEVTVDGATVGEVLKALDAAHPASASGSSTRPASCAGSSTSSSTTRTSASSTGSTRR